MSNFSPTNICRREEEIEKTGHEDIRHRTTIYKSLSDVLSFCFAGVVIENDPDTTCITKVPGDAR